MLSRASALLSVNKMATRNGLEPSTSSVTGWRANRLHHRAIKGQMPEDEIALLPEEYQVESVVKLQVPALDGERHLVVIKANKI